jgi:hypothetical protein
VEPDAPVAAVADVAGRLGSVSSGGGAASPGRKPWKGAPRIRKDPVVEGGARSCARSYGREMRRGKGKGGGTLEGLAKEKERALVGEVDLRDWRGMRPAGAPLPGHELVALLRGERVPEPREVCVHLGGRVQ